MRIILNLLLFIASLLGLLLILLLVAVIRTLLMPSKVSAYRAPESGGSPEE